MTHNNIETSSFHVQKSKVDKINQFIIGIINAYRSTKIIKFEKFVDLCQVEFQVTKNDIQSRLVHMIHTRQISGFLSVEGFNRDILHSVQCQICDTTVRNPLLYWQCPECYRYVCESCQDLHVVCPTPKKPRTRLIKMPLICSACQNVIKDLSRIKNYTCPYCHEPFPPPL
ncbi:MAG: hypothetical protein ACTSUV_00985 [Candidatus Ranarchaeia archaeon]